MEKRRRLEWILDALSLGSVLQYVAYRFLQSTMFVFYYSQTYKLITMALLIVFGGIRWLYIATQKWKERDGEGRKKFVLYCLGAAVLALPFIYLGWKHDYKFLIFLPVCCMCLYDMEAGKVLKAFFVVIGTLLLATIICSLSGTVRNLTNVGDDGRVVAAYGTINTTDFASYFTFLLLAIWCGMKNSSWQSCIMFAVVVAGASYLAFYLTDSRTVLYLGAIIVFLVLWEGFTRNRKVLQRATDSVATIAFPLIGIIVFFLVYNYAQRAPWAVQADQILSTRLSTTLDPYNKYGIHPFGNAIETMHGRGGTIVSYGWSSGYGYLDIAYAMLAIRYGWVITALVTSIWVWMTVRTVRQGNRRVALAMAIMAMHVFSEARILDINYNIFLAMPFCAFDRTEEKREQKKMARLISGMAVVGGVLLLLPRILSWLRTVFSGKGWNSGTAAFNSLIVCVGIVAFNGAFWFFLTRIAEKHDGKAIIGLASVLAICVGGVIAANNYISGQMVA